MHNGAVSDPGVGFLSQPLQEPAAMSAATYLSVPGFFATMKKSRGK
jgi:hypothetical protein